MDKLKLFGGLFLIILIILINLYYFFDPITLGVGLGLGGNLLLTGYLE